jgi:hypothetical protein
MIPAGAIVVFLIEINPVRPNVPPHSSLRAKRSNPALPRQESWIASSLSLLAMTIRSVIAP